MSGGLSILMPVFNERATIEAAIQDYAKEVRSRAFPGPEHVYGIKPKA